MQSRRRAVSRGTPLEPMRSRPADLGGVPGERGLHPVLAVSLGAAGLFVADACLDSCRDLAGSAGFRLRPMSESESGSGLPRICFE